MSGSHPAPGASPASPIQAELAGFITGARYGALTPTLVTRMKWSLLDSLGCGLHGSNTEWGRIVARLAQSQGAGPAHLWGENGAPRVATLGAVLANGTMIQSFELDDVHYGSRSHPGSVTVPIAIALIDSGMAISGRTLIEAMAVGYEVLARVGACQGVSSFDRGWHPTGTAGSFAAAATASRLLGLTQDQTVHALGIAGTMPAGLMAAQYGAMVKRLYSGHAAWAGLTAAYLAREGFTGVQDIFDASFGGYPRALSDRVSLDPLTRALGTRWDAEAIGYKLYSCVGTNHTMLAALEEIVRGTEFHWTDVEKIRITTSEYQVLHSGWPYTPSTVMAAQMNMQYCAAVLLMQGAVFIEQFEERHLADPAILDLAHKVEAISDPDQDHKDRTAAVEVLLRDGRRLHARTSAARGHPDNPPADADIQGKFLRLAEHIIPPGQAERLVELVDNLEQQGALDALPSLLVSPTST